MAYERYASNEFPEGPSRYVDQIIVRNLKTGRVLHTLPTGTRTSLPANSEDENAGDIGIGKATALVPKADGSVAWIVATGSIVAKHLSRTYEVNAVDQTGSRELASAPDIAPASLALAGSTLYWTQGGQPSSATLR